VNPNNKEAGRTELESKPGAMPVGTAMAQLLTQAQSKLVKGGGGYAAPSSPGGPKPKHG
jgi:hypothetical protein